MQAPTHAAYERIKATSVPVTLVGESARLVQWLKKPGDRVEKYDPLATLETDGVESELSATVGGTVKLLMFHAGVEVEVGDILCYVQPATPLVVKPSSGVERFSDTPATDTLPLTPSPVPATPPPSPVIRDASPGAIPIEQRVPSRQPTLTRDALPAVEELTIAVASAYQDQPKPSRRPSSPVKPKRGKTTHKTYHLEESQVQRVKRLSLELQLDDHNPLDCNESELIRAAVEMLLALPRPALEATLSVNRDREKAGRYGSGWPRPGKS